MNFDFYLDLLKFSTYIVMVGLISIYIAYMVLGEEKLEDLIENLNLERLSKINLNNNELIFNYILFKLRGIKKYLNC